MTTKIELPEKLIDKLVDLPEQGMGYQVVTVTLKDGRILQDRRVLNSKYLLILSNESIVTEDIENIELYKE